MSNFIGVISSCRSYDKDANNWFDSIASNGGSITPQAKVIFDKMIRGLKKDGVWTNIFEMGVFFGLENLTSSLVKIKYNSSYASSRLMVNSGFVSGDYTKQGSGLGLQGAASKRIGTTSSILSLPSTAFSMGVAVNTPNTSGTNIYLGSSYLPTGDSNRFLIGYVGGMLAGFGNVGTAYYAASTEGLYSIATNSTQNLLYRNGVLENTVAWNTQGFNSGEVYISTAGSYYGLSKIRFYYLGNNSVDQAKLYTHLNTALESFKAL